MEQGTGELWPIVRDQYIRDPMAGKLTFAAFYNLLVCCFSEVVDFNKVGVLIYYHKVVSAIDFT